MMEAVGRRKAHWLFGAGSEKAFSGKHRPQEDMVTSAVFGSIKLMSQEYRFEALKILLGQNAFEATGFVKSHDVEAELWPRLTGLKGRRHVEPDVLLRSTDKIVIVEVKWHAPLSERQLERQIEAVGAENVSAVIMLGEAGIEDEILDTRCFRRTWRDVSGALQFREDDVNTPLGRWVKMMQEFLQETDMGRIFKGLTKLDKMASVSYQFRMPGYPPGLEITPTIVKPTYYTFERSI